MLCLLLLLVVLGGLSCSKDRPPTAPAGKSTSDYSDLFDLFNSLQESDGDTASDSTASSSPDSSSSSDSTSSAPDSLVFSPTAAVAIPDAALRRYIEKVLKKHRGATITQADMRTLVNLLEGHTAFQGIGYRLKIKSLVGLEAATNLQNVAFGFNEISNLTPLANLDRLRSLDLRDNEVSDLAPLANLPKLRSLDLRDNPPLSDASINDHVPALERRGVEVVLSPYDRTFRDSPFDIELVFLDDFTEDEQEIWHRAARRWEEVIQEDMPDFTYPNPRLATCGDHDFTIPAGDQVDDLRVYLTKQSLHGAAGIFWYHTSENLDTGTFSDYRCIGIDPEYSTRFEDIWYIGLHEIGHALGIVPSSFPPHADLLSRSNRMIRRRRTADAHFAGPQAIAAFDQAGGRDYQGAKVPTQQYGTHWDGGVLAGELMTLQGWGALSAITLGALSDLGYTVDFSMADPYELPPPRAAKPIADAVPFCSVKVLPAPVYVDD